MSNMRWWHVVTCVSIVVAAPVWHRLVAAQTVPVHVLKITGGPAGVERDGSFALTSERSVFNRTDDREVFVLFQWEGAPGAHKLVARWRSPDGRLTSNSEVDYVAKAQRFGAYWSLPLTPSMALGFWSIEATVDGLPAGQFSFELTDRSVPSAVTKPALTQTQLYDRLDRLFVVLERTGGAQQPIASWAGTNGGGGFIYTTAGALDNADTVQVVSGQATRTTLVDVAGFNRPLGWALMPAPGMVDSTPRVSVDATGVGSRCVSMVGSEGRGRALAECVVTGRGRRADATVLIAEFRGGPASPGAPVMNEFGELIGVVGDRVTTGTGRVVGVTDDVGTTILPVDVFVPSATPTTAGNLRASGATLAGLVDEHRVLTANFVGTDKSGKPVATNVRQDFSVRDKFFGVLIWWDTSDRIRGDATVQLFDEQNNRIGTSSPSKVDVRKGQRGFTAWGVAVPATPGTYRVDVLLGSDPVWRDALRVTR